MTFDQIKEASLSCGQYDDLGCFFGSQTGADVAKKTRFDKASEYVNRAIGSFHNDPADSDFQLGYLAALLDVKREGMEEHSDDADKVYAGLASFVCLPEDVANG